MDCLLALLERQPADSQQAAGEERAPKRSQKPSAAKSMPDSPETGRSTQ